MHAFRADGVAAMAQAGADPAAWLCELIQEDGTTRQQIVTEDPDGLRWNDIGEPSPYRTTPLYAAATAPRWWKCDTHGPAKAGAWGCPECVREMRAEIERLSADRDSEIRRRKDSDDLATDLRLALEAVMSRPSDTGMAWAALERIHGAGYRQGPNV